MARKAIQNDQIVKLIVGAGQASPSPPVGPALGSKGVKSMDFCKVSNPPSLLPLPPSLSLLKKDHSLNKYLTYHHRNSTREQQTTSPAPRYPHE